MKAEGEDRGEEEESESSSVRGTYLDGVSAVVDKSKRDFGHVGPSLVSRLLRFDRVDFQ